MAKKGTSSATTPRMNLYIPIELQQQMHVAASRAGVSVSEWVRVIVSDYIEKKYAPDELYDPEESPLLQDIIIQRLDKFIFDYQLLRERLTMIQNAQKELQADIQERLKNNPELLKFSEEDLAKLMKVGELFIDKAKESVDKQVEARRKRKK
jgi:hypothetical protein